MHRCIKSLVQAELVKNRAFAVMTIFQGAVRRLLPFITLNILAQTDRNVNPKARKKQSENSTKQDASFGIKIAILQKLA